MRSQATRSFLAILNALALTACASDSTTGPTPPPPPPAVAVVTVSPDSLTLATGAATTLSVTTKDANGTTLSGRTVQWTSSNSTIATVTAQGVVTALVPGSARIYATSEQKTGSAIVTVVASPPPPNQVASVTLDASSASIDEGGEHQFVATPRDVNGAPIPGLGMQWTSSDATIASVSALGRVTGVRAGVATITVRVHGQTAEAIVTVRALEAFDLLFADYENGALELFTMTLAQPNASPSRLLPLGTFAGEARPSPDGSKIVFVGTVSGAPGIYVMNRDATQLRRIVVPQLGFVVNPNWSPDGLKIVYEGGSTASQRDIWVVNADGTNPVNLTADLQNTDQLTPSWSPSLGGSTSRIAFVHRSNGTERVWTMRPDGTDKRQITGGVLDLQPSWSPDGQTIVYTRTNAVVNADVWLVNANGSGNERPVMLFLSLAGPQMHPVFSPDGRMIAFSSMHETYGQGAYDQEIYTVWLDGTKLARRTTAGGYWPAFLKR